MLSLNVAEIHVLRIELKQISQRGIGQPLSDCVVKGDMAKLLSHCFLSPGRKREDLQMRVVKV
jgi:hypothetical protein